MASIFFTACGGQNNIPTAIPSFTSEPTIKATPTLTKTPRPTLPPTLTITPLPLYQNKKVLFAYYVIGDYSVYDTFFDYDAFFGLDLYRSYPRSYPKLILYDDGLLIIPGEKYKQKKLSADEINQFLSKLETLGFYSLESNQKHDPTDRLYNYENNYQLSFDGREYCVAVNNDRPRNLCVYEPHIKYLIPKMKRLLEYLEEYEPSGMTPYYPDRILLWIQSGRDPYNNNLPKNTITWDEKFPRLRNSLVYADGNLAKENSLIYLDGDWAKEIYMLYENTNQGNVFTQDGKEYTIYIDIVLPHEKVTNSVYQ